MKHLSKFLLAALVTVLLASCSLDNRYQFEEFELTSGLSVFLTEEGKVAVTTLKNRNHNITTEFWIDGQKTDVDAMKLALPAGNSFRTAYDPSYYVTNFVRNQEGTMNEYKFYRNYTINFLSKIYYYKNGEQVVMDTTSMTYGVIQSVDGTGHEVFSGLFGEPVPHHIYGTVLKPTKAFYWDENKKVHYLPLPENYYYYNGVSAIHKSGDNVYVAGLMDFPMYWKNSDVVRPVNHNRYGEVTAITTLGNDDYASGFYNKLSDGKEVRTACYWKNTELVELQENGVANGIFVDDEGNVYVTGAIGQFESEYKACYWKNGERVMLTESDEGVTE